MPTSLTVYQKKNLSKMPHIPKNAPFSYDQRSWLDGFMSGLNAMRFMDSGNNLNQVSENKAVMNILYGTQTGNAEELANDAATIAEKRGFQPKITELDEIDLSLFAQMEHALIVVSTYGEGEMPDNANTFWEALSAETAPKMEKLNYAVLGLGDTSYDEFCQAGKLIDKRLEQLGAARMAKRIDCDIDYEEPAALWLDETIPLSENPNGADVTHLDQNVVQITDNKKSKWSRKNPYSAVMVENRLLSGTRSAKEIRHVSFDLGDSDIKYEAGDSLGIIPKNTPDLVEKILRRTDAEFDDVVKGYDSPVGELLTSSFEISTPSKDFIHNIKQQIDSPELNDVSKNNDELSKFLWGKDILDLLNLDPNFKINIDTLLTWLKPLQYRAYSISSSPKAQKKEVHLTVSAVRWTYNNRIHKGVASTFLADQIKVGQTGNIFLSPNKNFRPPNDNQVPMIMVGPGTGIAPFRAFLQERGATGATGMNWLFFGDQHRESDFLYEDELKRMQTSGLLDRLDVAFSRDQTEKIYVQDMMIKQGKALYAAIENGGHFYICGDATRMAKDVEKALIGIIAKHGSFSSEHAIEYISNLKRQKRFLRDVY